MHDTERDALLPQPAAHPGDAAATATTAPARRKQVQATRPLNAKAGFVMRCLQFIAHCFSCAKEQPAKELNAAQRAAALRAVQTTPPVTFKGETTSTLVTPMGAYAGKPLEQALRKRAEQQFTAMDITQTTMH